MTNNIFYKALAVLSTAGIVLIAGMKITTRLLTPTKNSSLFRYRLRNLLLLIENNPFLK
tara:strand:- start:2496 stop:2672 length:177 start_codon:yes stop_codon:yes gene_type:complete